MASPFPGMDPYLENPATWPNLHSRLIVAIANHLAPHLRPHYRVVVEEAVYKNDTQDTAVLIGVPDIAIRQTSTATPTTRSLAVADPEPISITLPMPALMPASIPSTYTMPCPPSCSPCDRTIPKFPWTSNTCSTKSMTSLATTCLSTIVKTQNLPGQMQS